MPPLIKNRNEEEEEIRSIIEEKQDINDKSAESSKEDYRLQIVWRNVAIMAYLHMAALYGLYLCFTSAQFKTVVAGKMSLNNM